MLDYIVIGAGPSGLIVNGELHKSGLKGFCLESGKVIKTETNDIYSGYQIRNGYKNKGINLIFGKPLFLLNEAECVGGGSSVNSSLHHRTPRHIWQSWIVNYRLENFSYKEAIKLYEEVEKMFSCSFSTVNMPDFYKKAKETLKVDQIQRWGYQKDNLFKRKTAVDVIKEYYPSSFSKVKSNHKVIGLKKTALNQFQVIYKIDEKLKKIYCRNLFICAGAGYSPILLANLKYHHKNLGKFKVHPTARVSLISKSSTNYQEIVEPFQITEFFPHLMIGSSANRGFLSQANYPFKNSNVDFNSSLNLYSMAPSNKSGFQILNGLWKGTRFYNLDKKTKNKIKFGLETIIKIASKSSYTHVYSPGGIINLENLKKNLTNNFINKTIQKTLSSVHIFSSAAVGENTDLCPVRSNGSVNGIEGVYLMDSSCIPSCPTVNPQSTTVIFALKMIREFLKK